MIPRRGFVAGLLAGVALPVRAYAEGIDRSPLPQRRPDLRPAPDPYEPLVAAAKLGGAVAFVVADAATGAVLASRLPDLAQPPASVLKAITALYALERLGPGFRYETVVLATGPVQDGVVQGDLVLVGAGDPTLQTDQLGALAQNLAAAGVRAVAGQFFYWDGALPYLPEIAGDQPTHVGYNPALSGLNLNFNRVHFEWRKAGGTWAMAMDARGEKFVPVVQMAGVRVVSRAAPLFTYQGSVGAEEWTVAAGALGKGGSRWLPVRHPGYYAAEVFSTLARAQGIALDAGAPAGDLPQGRVLARLPSAPLPDILADMLRFSTNLTAEAVGMQASRAATLLGSGATMTAWAKGRFGLSGRFVDHSGLGNQSRITAADMVRALVWAQGKGGSGGGDTMLASILRVYAMRDENGAEVEAHPVRIRAKSGTLNFASGLAGYVQPPPGGRRLAFAIFSADVDRRARLTEAEREEPQGGQAWTKRARRLQGQLINRWVGAFV